MAKKCKHKKVYDRECSVVLSPNRIDWICKKCGKLGSDTLYEADSALCTCGKECCSVTYKEVYDKFYG